MLKSKKKFSKIYDKNVERIYRFVFLKVDTQETAEDITSQVFIKAWKIIKKDSKQKEEIKNISAYLYQIARREIVNHYRGRAKIRTVSIESLQIKDTQTDLEKEKISQDEIGEMKKAISQLGDDYQNIIIWRHLDGLSYKKIAQITGKPEGTIRMINHRALKELRGKMSGEVDKWTSGQVNK